MLECLNLTLILSENRYDGFPLKCSNKTATSCNDLLFIESSYYSFYTINIYVKIEELYTAYWGDHSRLTSRYSFSLDVAGRCLGTPLWARQMKAPASAALTLWMDKIDPFNVVSTVALEATLENSFRCWESFILKTNYSTKCIRTWKYLSILWKKNIYLSTHNSSIVDTWG